MPSVRRFRLLGSVAICAAAVAGFSPRAKAADGPLREVIDQRIEEAWAREKIKPAELAGDAEFLRRQFLDLIGVIPSYEEAAGFLDDTSADKRAKLIDRLLEDPRFAQHQADIWDMVLFGRNPPGYDTDKRVAFQDWLREQFAKNRPYDEWVRDILRAEGNSEDNGAPMYYVQYKNQPLDAAEAVTQTFLGVQLQCARCHDHPFESWTQTDFYGLAAFLTRLDVVNVGKKNKRTAYAIGEMNTGEVLFTGPASEQTPGKKGEPIKPKFLLGGLLEEPPLPKDVKDPRNFPSGKMPPAPVFAQGPPGRLGYRRQEPILCPRGGQSRVGPIHGSRAGAAGEQHERVEPSQPSEAAGRLERRVDRAQVRPQVVHSRVVQQRNLSTVVGRSGRRRQTAVV